MSSKKLHSFSFDANSLAICQPNGVLRIWNTSNNILEHEFQPSKHLSSATNCLSYSKAVRKTKKHQLIAMGTVSGNILIYNPSLQEQVSTLEHSSTSPVVDLDWLTNTTLVSLAADGSLVLWDIVKTEKLKSRKVGKNNAVSMFSKNKAIVASMGIKLINLDSKSKDEHVFTGHKNRVSHLVPVHLENEDVASHFLSAAEGEGFFYAWSTSCDSHDPISAFSVNDTVNSISSVKIDATSVGIVVTTRKGILLYYSHHLNGVKRQKPVKSKHSFTVELEGSDEDQKIPIITAHFISKDVILFVYGSEMYLRCEKISVDSLIETKSLKRSDPTHFSQKKEKKLLKTITPHISNDVVHLTPGDFSEQKEAQSTGVKRKKGDPTLHKPMEERLTALSIEKPLSSLRKGGPLVSDSVHLLMQGLHSKDSKLLHSVLLKGEKEEVVSNTVKKLPVECIVPLLQALHNFIAGKGQRNCIINWMKCVLVHHMSHLSSLPNKKDIFEPFYVMSTAKMATLPEMTKLHSRLDLLLTHVTQRHENSAKKQDDQDPLLFYKDESDDENKMETAGLPSESEDFADIWSEGDIDDDENKNNSEANFISGSDQDSSKNSRKKRSVTSLRSDSPMSESFLVTDSEEDENDDQNAIRGSDSSDEDDIDMNEMPRIANNSKLQRSDTEESSD